MKTKLKSDRASDAASCSRFFIAQPGDLTGKLAPLQMWHEWEVGDSRDQNRICLTSCKRKAELIRDALELFHANTSMQAPAPGEAVETKTES